MNVFKFICLLLLFSSLFPFISAASTITLTVTVVYAINTQRVATIASFSDSINNPNDPSVHCNFVFPADALSSGATVAMTVYSTAESVITADAPLPSGKLGANTFYSFSFTNTNTGSAVTSFDKTITLTFFYSDADVSGIDESTLVPYRWNGSAWSALTGYTVDTVANKVTVSTKQFSTFALLGTASAQQQQSSSSGGGGGGGDGGSSIPETKVVFSGLAYPKSKVVLLKDAQIVATTIADSNANFQVSASGLSANNYIFSIYAQDDKGNRPPLLTFPVSVTPVVTTQIGDVLIPPLVTVDKEEIKKGDNVVILGQSAPKADIIIVISSDKEFFVKTVADANGAYLYNFDTTQLDTGRQFIKAKTAVAGRISSFSKPISLTVGTKTILAKPATIPTKGDLNSDKLVNLVDFSITAYWYKRPNPPATTDLNGDGKVDLIDFSIMAFYWTG